MDRQRTQKQITFNVKGQKGTIPAVGLGTVGLNEKCTASCLAALAAGYRHLDSALSYGNHQDVGEAIRQSGLSREDVFVSTKIGFCPCVIPDESDAYWLYDPVNTKGNETACVDLCLKQLGLDYVDLLYGEKLRSIHKSISSFLIKTYLNMLLIFAIYYLVTSPIDHNVTLLFFIAST